MSAKKFIDEHGYYTCRKCSVIYELNNTNFHVNNRSKSGLLSWCKACSNKLRRERWHSKSSHNIPRTCLNCRCFFYAALLQVNKAKRHGKLIKDVVYCSFDCHKAHSPKTLFASQTHCHFKGKSWNGKRQGANNPNAKISEKTIKDIKVKLKDGVRNKVIAALYNLKSDYISQIKAGRIWASVVV